MANKTDINNAWENAKKVRGQNPNLYRQDPYGNKMFKPSYGKQSEMGWELDHKNPKAKGGSNLQRNHQALQWKTNREKSNKYPYNPK